VLDRPDDQRGGGPQGGGVGGVASGVLARLGEDFVAVVG